MGHFDLLQVSDDEDQQQQAATLKPPTQESPVAVVKKVASPDLGGGEWEQQTHRHARKGSGKGLSQASQTAQATQAPQTAHQGHFEKTTSAHGHPIIRRPKPAPLQLAELSPQQTIELYAFPPTHRTANLRTLLAAHEGHYRLKWHHDTSAWVHFDTADLAKTVLAQWTDDLVQVRPFDPANVQQQQQQPESQTE